MPGADTSFVPVLDEPVCSAKVRTNTALEIFQVQLSHSTLFRTVVLHFSRQAKERDAMVVIGFSPASLLVCADEHLSLQIFCCPCRTSRALG